MEQRSTPVRRKTATPDGRTAPRGRDKRTSGAYATSAFVRMFRASDIERIAIVRDGVPARYLVEIGQQMVMPKERLYDALRLPRSTIDRKIKADDRLSAEQSERVVGLERLVGQVETIVAESGDPEGFDAAQWLGEWLERPSPALGGARPADFMDTMEGQGLVTRLLLQSQAGVFA